MATKPYNDIYERLTQGPAAKEEALIGMVAYSLYKRSKAEACTKARANGKPLTGPDLDAFHEAFGDTMQKALEAQAKETLLAFANEYLEREKPRIVADAIGSLKLHVTAEVKENTTFMKAFWPSLVSSLAFLILAAVVALCWSASNIDLMRGFLNIISPPKAVAVEPPPDIQKGHPQHVIEPKTTVDNAK
jgi:hypothetical protein